MRESEDFTVLGDSALLSRRMEMRAELERLPPESSDHATLAVRYNRSTEEIEARASGARSQANQGEGQQAAHRS